MSTAAAPLALYRDTVPGQWIDYNGHMNVAYYVLAFDRATDALLEHVGLGRDYRGRTQRSVFTLENHVSYLRELLQGEAFYCTTQLIDCDAKRIHYFQHLYHAGREELAATCEAILLHMDMNQRRAATFEPGIDARLQAVLDEHRRLPRPAQLGSVIGIRRKS